MIGESSSVFRIPALLWLALTASVAIGQELEPRRWSHLPVGVNFAGVGYSYIDSDIFFDPALEIEDTESQVHVTAFSYVRALDVFGRSGRFDVLVPYAAGRWEGILRGEPASVRRRGFADPKLRFAVNVLGSPAQTGEAFRAFKPSTIVGVALDVTMPLGEYRDDKLINLGSNRWVFRPQLGIVRFWDKWSAELTTSAFFYTTNDDFFGDVEREQDPLYAIQGHLIYTFRPGLWASLSSAYGGGAQSEIDDVKVGDRKGNWLWAASVGIPIDRRHGLKIAYLRGQTTRDTGRDWNQLILAYSVLWGGN